MAKQTSGSYYDTNWAPIAQISTAQTNRAPSDVTNMTALGAAAGSGGRYVDHVDFVPQASPAAGVARVWQRAGDAGAPNLLAELAIPTSTATTTAAQPTYSLSIQKGIPSGDRIYVSYQTSDAFDVNGVGSE